MSQRFDKPSEEPSVTDEVNATLSAILPWGVSILAHAAVVLLAIFLLWTTVIREPVEPTVTPTLDLTPAPQIRLKTPEPVAPKPDRPDRHPARPDPKPTDIPIRTIGLDVKPTLIGSAASHQNPFTGTQIGSSKSVGIWTVKQSNVSRVVFVIDASGSLIDTLPFVTRELQRSIHTLTDEQSFAVIFFQGDRVVHVPPPARLQPATADNKASVADWISPANHNVEPGGKTNPLPAIRAALAMRPQAIFLLSDNITGQGEAAIAQEDLLNEIARANVGRTRISTIQFLYPDPIASLPGRKGTLEMIAEQTGGVYKFLDARELNIQ